MYIAIFDESENLSPRLEDVLKVLSLVAKRYRSPQPPLKRGALIPVPPLKS